MNTTDDYIKKNKDSWNKRTPYHLSSEFYNLEGFLKGQTSLNDIELALLGDLRGKSILHLQCHFGQDTLSLARMGAKATGMDFSEEAIKQARELNDKMGLDAEFVCCDVYDLPQHLDKNFDLVFASYGTIGWLPDLQKWGNIIAHFLKPGGKLVFVEFHPVVWMFDEKFEKVGYNYFNDGPIVEKTSGTYANKDAPIQHENISWNHSLTEVIGSLILNGMELIHFGEYDYSPYECFNSMEKTGLGQYRIRHLENKIPMVYSIVAVKN